MTEIAEEREATKSKLNMMLIMFIMLIGLYMIYKMLNWAVDHRIKSVEVVEEHQITAQVRERQLACLAKNIYHEAGSEPFEGKVAVAQVTLNRANSDGKFPGDICHVVYQKNIFYEKVLCQFSWVCHRHANFKPKYPDIYDESMTVAKKVLLEGFRLPSLTEALYFHADHVNPGWKLTRVGKIGNHIFYKDSK
ncbi:MAG: cell wall hydrolase [Proteobacteria bacterium]|nr:cell wall hydrolase [Pseudomonadota bacterium]